MSKQETKHRVVGRRKESRPAQQTTRIWQEQPCPDNPYLANAARCHGYDLVELMTQRSYADVLFLLFQGNLPNKNQAELLEKLMIGLINPGPRHPATRAGMAAAVGRTDTAHILPISLSILGGRVNGGSEVEESMRFLRKHKKTDPRALAQELLHQPPPKEAGDWHIAPGFGELFGHTDPLTANLVAAFLEQPDTGPTLRWGQDFCDVLAEKSLGWLATGLAAGILVDLKFHPRVAVGLYQLLCAPGILAHGLELSNKPFSALPFPGDEDYVIE